MEIKIKKYCSKSFAPNNFTSSLYMNRSLIIKKGSTKKEKPEQIDVIEVETDISERRKSIKDLRITNKEIRLIKHPYFQKNLEIITVNPSQNNLSNEKSKPMVWNSGENKENV